MAENQVTVSYKTIGLSDLKNAAELIAQTGKHAETTGQAYDALGAAVLRTLKADKQLSTEMRKLNKDRIAGKIELKDYIRAEEELYRVRGETINRDKELIRIEGQREKARQKEAADLERIKQKYDSAYAAQKKYDKEISDINKAFGKDSDKAEKAIAVVTKEYKEFLRATKNGDVIDAGNQFARFSDQAYRAQQRIKRFASVGLQQAGYQVGDFIVQIQSGQNVLVALGQQGSQLAGIFGTGGAVVGAGIAAATAIGMIFYEAYKTTNNIKTMDEASSDLSSSISDLTTNLDRIADTKLDETFGNMTNSIRKMSEELSKLGQLKVLRDYQASVMAISAETAGISPGRKIATGAKRFAMDMLVMPDPRMIEKYRNDVADLYIEKWEKLGIDMSRAQFDAYRKDLLYQSSKGNTEAVTKITEKFIKDATDGAKGIFGLSAAGQDLVFGLGKTAIVVSELTANINGTAEKAEKARAALKKLKDAADELAERDFKAVIYTRDTVEGLEREAKLMETSVKGKTAIAALNRKIFEDQLSGNNLQGYQIKQIMEAYDNLQKVTGETEAFKEEAEKTKAVLEKIDGVISSIRGNISSLEISVIGEAVRLAALKAGKSIEESKLAGQLAEKQAAFNASLPDMPDGARRAAREANLRELQLMAEKAGLVAQSKVIEDKIRDSKKKGKEDPAIKMLEEIERRKVLIGLTEEQAKRQELVYKTEDKLGEFREKYGNDFINNIVNQTMALDEQQKVLDKAREQQKEIADVISSSFGDAFMSIVDGTSSVKDAFRNMASYIIKELFRILVVQQMVNALAGAITGTGAAPTSTSIPPPLPRPTASANGNAFYGGNVIPFAKGGVVDSPMMFPMAGGNTGLMGEAGPEAIMPLKRGKGGKLGVVAESQGNVVINQSFNFSANGDESVKKIIAQAAPQIAQMTKSSIINDRRRGGSMKAAFG
jgi:lambda family phage tail tape measure protein